jgi:hypothetical protein
MAKPYDALACAQIIPRLPHAFRPQDGKRIPRGLVGATIVRFGTVANEVSEASNASLEGGGLLIDYIPRGETVPRRVAMAFNDVAMWVAYQAIAADGSERGSTPACAPG